MSSKQNKKVKGWAVVMKEKKIIHRDYAMQYTFELEKESPSQEIFVIGTEEKQAKRWLKKWNSIERSVVVPCTITYSLPKKRV